jgi:large subunit ribosomal protein L9
MWSVSAASWRPEKPRSATSRPPFPCRVGETGHLYGSVTSGDIADALKAKGFEIDRRKLILPEALKTLGEHIVNLKLHREVMVPLKVKVVKEN